MNLTVRGFKLPVLPAGGSHNYY